MCIGGGERGDEEIRRAKATEPLLCAPKPHIATRREKAGRWRPSGGITPPLPGASSAGASISPHSRGLIGSVRSDLQEGQVASGDCKGRRKRDLRTVWWTLTGTVSHCATELSLRVLTPWEGSSGVRQTRTLPAGAASRVGLLVQGWGSPLSSAAFQAGSCSAVCPTHCRCLQQPWHLPSRRQRHPPSHGSQKCLQTRPRAPPLRSACWRNTCPSPTRSCQCWGRAWGSHMDTLSWNGSCPTLREAMESY